MAEKSTPEAWASRTTSQLAFKDTRNIFYCRYFMKRVKDPMAIRHTASGFRALPRPQQPPWQRPCCNPVTIGHFTIYNGRDITIRLLQ